MNTELLSIDNRKLQQTFLQIRSNKAFELFVVSIIIFSALSIGARTYDIPPHLASAIGWLDWLITVIFLVEIVIRFLGEEHKARFFHNGWNVFDTLIVALTLFQYLTVADFL